MLWSVSAFAAPGDAPASPKPPAEVKAADKATRKKASGPPNAPHAPGTGDETAQDKAKSEVREAAQEAREDLREAREQVRETMKQAREEMREEMKEAREEMRAAGEQVRAAGDEMREEMREAHAQAKERWRELHGAMLEAMRKHGTELREAAEATRERVREARRKVWHELRAGVSDAKGIPAAVSQEMRHHARRMARLLRVLALSEQKNDTETQDRVKRLIAREQERHDRKVDHLLGLRTARGAAERQGDPAAAGAPSGAKEGVAKGHAEGAPGAGDKPAAAAAGKGKQTPPREAAAKENAP
jgi:vacuolar-type H+-ATPase subunit H